MTEVGRGRVLDISTKNWIGRRRIGSEASIRGIAKSNRLCLLKPLAELIGAHVMAGHVIRADDTPVDVLAPGNGKTKTGRLWVYLRDERPHGGSAPPAVLYRYTPDRRGEHCRAQLAEFTGWLHADGYAGFGRL